MSKVETATETKKMRKPGKFIMAGLDEESCGSCSLVELEGEDPEAVVELADNRFCGVETQLLQ